MPCDSERFNTNHPALCPTLRWKGMFILSEREPSVPPTNDGIYWCGQTQNCIGPDGKLAEPSQCSSLLRKCHGSNCE
jgi:hypothetical protein